MKTRILFEDEELLVVYKPAGIATQAAGFMQADVVSELKNYLIKNAVRKGAASKEAKEPYLGLVHRLDQPVEGVLVFAKTSVAAAALSRQITEQTLKKEYLAAVYLPEEKPGQNEIVLTDYLIKDGKTNISRVASKGEKKQKKRFYLIMCKRFGRQKMENGLPCFGLSFRPGGIIRFAYSFQMPECRFWETGNTERKLLKKSVTGWVLRMWHYAPKALFLNIQKQEKSANSRFLHKKKSCRI